MSAIRRVLRIPALALALVFAVASPVVAQDAPAVEADAASLAIERVSVERDSTRFPRELTVRVIVRNTGDVRLRPLVQVNGRRASGPEALLTRSMEIYVLTERVPVWGGPQTFRVEVRTQFGVALAENVPGPAAQRVVHVFTMPWRPMAAGLALVVFVTAILVWRWRRRRRLRRWTAKLRAMEEELLGVG